MSSNNSSSPDSGSATCTLAAQACSSCRKQKRKCDKGLPSCGLCVRIGRPCDYSVDAPSNAFGAPTSEEFEELRRKVGELETVLARAGKSSSLRGSNGDVHMIGSGNSESASPAGDVPISQTIAATAPWIGSSGFPSLFFLDSQMFEYERFTIQTPYIRVPAGALQSLGSSGDLRAMIERYFSTVHVYFSVVSKIRLYQHLAHPTHEIGADMALLFLAMKLAMSEPRDGPMPPQLYQDVKSFYSYVEAQHGFSIQLIQAALLISLYEVGHGIYPAAYLTIGNCARLGHAMGIHERNVPQMLPRATTWTEQEERRRVWWGVVVLDRYVNLGHQGKPFASAEPGLDTHLPTDDGSWDRGQMLAAAPLALSASQNIPASPFARTCQASHLLGKVIRHVNDHTIPAAYRFDEALQLHRTLRALADAMLSETTENYSIEGPPLCTALSICYSAILTLYDSYSCTEKSMRDAPETQLTMQQEAISGISEFTELAMQMARRLKAFVDKVGLENVSPLVVDSLYQAAANCTRDPSKASFFSHRAMAALTS